MTLNEAEKLLDGFLGDVTSALEFQRAEPLIYSRLTADVTALLAFPCRLDARGPACFGCSVWLRFEPLEQLLRGASEKPIIPTISMPLHLLRKNQSFIEWQFYGRRDLEKLTDIILSDLRDCALPFIERYSKLPELRRKLEGPSPKDWFALSPEQRVNILAVIQFVEGDKLGALKTLEDALLERKTALPKKRLPIERVRQRLAEAA